MRCEFGDGLRVSYTGPLQITKGQDVNVFIRESSLPDDIRGDLDMALYRNSCNSLREVADRVTKKFGSRACIHE